MGASSVSTTTSTTTTKRSIRISTTYRLSIKKTRQDHYNNIALTVQGPTNRLQSLVCNTNGLALLYGQRRT
ncbi:hypothetical protein PoB_006134800 [Plakobranchus ocellatus]|uniref:Uncharacterized protein n=1 Tax=Plakobranchus ocellatus TaxID=259542 RepID=A0AAV4CSD8_9GAST|nr:hypothetical protein PoB_006134800 [Plakobranchus ocellatus]